MEHGKLIALDQYLQTAYSDDRLSEATRFGTDSAAQIYDFQHYQAREKDRKARERKARDRSLAILEVITANLVDYQEHMNAAAAECDVEAYRQQYGILPEFQIADDVRRLKHFVQCLGGAFDSREVRTLMEAGELLRATAPEEVVDTFNYILTSEYFGFQAISALIQSTHLNDEAYFEDTMLYYKLWRDFAEMNYSHSLAVISQICFEEAIAI